MDPREWHWQGMPPMGDAPFFGYSAKRGYRNAKRADHTPSIHSFIQRLNLRNSTVPQVIVRMWHNSSPLKVGTLIWLTLNRGLLVGTWLQLMGIPPTYNICDSGVTKTPNTASSTALLLNALRRPSREFGNTRSRPRTSPYHGPSSYSGRLSTNVKMTPPVSMATMSVTFFTLGNLLISSIASSSIISGRRSAEGTSVTSTFSRRSFIRLGWPPSKSAWPLGKPLMLIASTRTRAL